MKSPRFKLSSIIIFFICLVVLISLTITILLITNSTSESIENQLEQKADNTSQIVAESQIVKSGLLMPETAPKIQDYTQSIQEATDVLFVVVIDMNGLRRSHPDPENIGKAFMGGDEKRAFQGENYISRSEGTLGKSLRSFTTIVDDEGNILGAVAVGISLEEVQSAIRRSQIKILTGSIIGLLIGVVGAFWLAWYIKRSLFGLEPYAIARIHEERNQMLQSVYEGVIAIDLESKIVMVNASARRIFQKAGLTEQEPLGMSIDEFLPGAMLEQMLVKIEPELDEEQNFNGVSVISNRVPLIVNGKVIGAIATFRDKTEVNLLAEQLTGIRLYADTLRAQSHEFMNQLHVLLGMIKLEEYEQVQQFIAKLTDYQAKEVGAVTQHIKDPVLSGFIIGKISYAREKHVELLIECETEIPKSKNPDVTHELITIVGNVIDNAIDSVKTEESRVVDMSLSYIDELLEVIIADSGPGIPYTMQETIFSKGVSSKNGKNRGFGLYLAKRSVEKLNGSIDLLSDKNQTRFTVIVPFGAGGEIE
ncbi:Two-component sensor histidine kinase, malate [Planococcus halocryophilus Or1]|uniref:histidine kinase n=1 Tax=Planococcus halocryophilus TaxID=1215089 RepID=A0A1C7DV75_9BACL|nr:DcuS/MalK family sensor histidine kinase [Planococcus halocryophilus]ANU15312.1 two-component system sensor histidine kinase DcuS [Planococcus halocryophilus]EMF47670.1 Two-component sensor histidine kinase, malate [Planococcus halocryophilus Or1]